MRKAKAVSYLLDRDGLLCPVDGGAHELVDEDGGVVGRCEVDRV